MTGLMFDRFHELLHRLERQQTRHSQIQRITSQILDDSPNWPKFVFGDVPDGSIDFGIELWNENLLELPFAACFMQFQESTSCIGYFAFRDSEQYRLVFIPVDLAGGAWPPIMLGHNGVGYMTDGLPDLTSNGRSAKDIMVEDTKWLAGGMMAMIGFLSTKGVKLERVGVSPRINRRRVARGDHPIPEYTIVRIDPNIQKSYERRGGTHASPRPHRRRGHIAVLDRGTDKERRIVKPPCFVMASDGIPPPIYRVESEKKPNPPSDPSTPSAS